ncbi:MAG: caspase family protein, partial [Acidobacteriota bacterium]|nr:caspase family protein [Acidobacteriota bacterium]
MRIRTKVRRLMMFAALLLACHERTSVTFATQPAPPPRKRALLIGIDDYSASRLKKRAEWQPVPQRVLPSLRGAATDVALVREMLTARYGFEEGGIVTLTNQQATREAIVAAIENVLIAPARKDDVLLFYYAGHGSQVDNSASSEPDGRDESIVPADSRLGATDIRDKQLAVLFNRVLDKQARLTLIFDSCHSGSVARALTTDERVRSVLPDPRDVHDASEPPEPEARGALVLSASKDFARAFETEDEQGRPHGVFSWALLHAMRSADRGEAASDTFLRAQALMRADSPYQDPVMSGDATARLTPFLSDDTSRAADSAIAVERVADDGTVILQGGWAHGLTLGTVLR